ncbi:MAG: hypothetical protein KDA80_14265 [Planctomycetaceae bacterium]|nr:hypothetical protein [Planctomycetaceae bacterium]
MTLRRQTPIITADRIQINPQKLLVSDRTPTTDPRIRIQRDGDIIQSIEITCSCGSQLILDCLYEVPSVEPEQ